MKIIYRCLFLFLINVGLLNGVAPTTGPLANIKEIACPNNSQLNSYEPRPGKFENQLIIPFGGKFLQWSPFEVEIGGVSRPYTNIGSMVPALQATSITITHDTTNGVWLVTCTFSITGTYPLLNAPTTTLAVHAEKCELVDTKPPLPTPSKMVSCN